MGQRRVTIKIRKQFSFNNNENMIFKSMQDITKATEGKLITLNAYNKKEGQLKNQLSKVPL